MLGPWPHYHELVGDLMNRNSSENTKKIMTNLQKCLLYFTLAVVYIGVPKFALGQRKEADFTFDTCAPLAGVDSVVDAFDLMIWYSNRFEAARGEYDPALVDECEIEHVRDFGDANLDTFVDVSDLNIWTDLDSATLLPRAFKPAGLSTVVVDDATYLSELHIPVADGPGPLFLTCLLYTSPSPRDKRQSRMPSSA